MSGRKDDGGKDMHELIPPIAMRALAKVLTFGATKAGKDGKGYGAHNWAKGLSWSRVYGALQRHLTSWAEGDDLDTGEGGSGMPHLWHALCELVFLVANEEYKLGTDDRHEWQAKKDEAEDTAITAEETINHPAVPSVR